MQKLSETLYSSLFWLISGLLIWLVILPLALICSPIIILGKAAGQIFSPMTQSNLVETQTRSQTNSAHKAANAVEPFLTTLLLKTLIEVPAFLAAVMSLQPKRLIPGEQVPVQRLQTPPLKVEEESSKAAKEIPAEEKPSGT
ncbi:hypothetical protein [Allocoleopsis sp.]|uniref:hypothetical protein n=1 Tax=Allocoleopsis sp. TaxID=3088169 RepID=UPI002FD235F2